MKQINTRYGAFISLNKLPGIPIWAQKWRRSTTQHISTVQEISLRQKALYPNVHRLLQILALMPVTTAKAER